MLSLNRHLFTETGTDSGALNVLGTIVHRFPDEGDYLVTARRDGRPVGQRVLVVGEEYHSQAAQIDLGSLEDGGDGCSCSCEAEDVICIRPDGFGVFHVSRGPGGYHVTVDPLEERDVQELDGAALTEYDTVSATLFRPGRYSIRNDLTDHASTIDVPYPEKGDQRPTEPVRVECDDRGFTEESITVAPAQGLVVEVDTDARIVIELDEPHEEASTDVDETPEKGPRPPRGHRIDPRRHDVEDLEKRLDAVERPGELKLMREVERASGNRSKATQAIERRLRDVEDNRANK